MSWDRRAEAYRDSAAHREGADLDTLVECCEPGEGVKVLDVATGGGHVARRLRERGCEVVTLDASPGMAPDVVSRAEELPFDDGSFDVVVSRLAAHHFDDPAASAGEMERVTARLVVIEDLLLGSEEHERAERLRDPSHVRSYSEEEWRRLLLDAGLELELVEEFEHEQDLGEWLARTGTAGEDAEEARRLLADRISPDGATLTDRRIVLKARKSQR